MAHKVVSNIFRWSFLAIFFTGIFAPATQMIFGDRVLFSFTEKRTLATFPNVPDNLSQVQKFYSDLDKYLNDHFGFRDWFIYRYQSELRKRFNHTSKETSVIRGKDNWYYFTDSDLLLDFTGKKPLSDSDLDNWLTSYRGKKRWLAERDIRYLFVVPPNKQSVYPEFTAETLGKSQGKSRLQQLKSLLTESDNSTFIDLAPILIDKKDNGTMFYKSDTHWTSYGAYLAFQVIAEKIEDFFPDISFKKDFPFTPELTRVCDKKRANCGDLTRMLLDFESFKESFKISSGFLKCASLSPFDFQLSDVNQSADAPSFAKSCKHGQLKAIVFRDSFLVALEPYLSENFAQVLYLWKGYNQDNLEKLLQIFKPDIVIEEKVERNLFSE